MTTLLVAEHDNATLGDATARSLTAALALGAPVHILVAGHHAGPAAEAAGRLAGVEKVLHADAAHYAGGLAEALGVLIASLADGYDALVAPATAKGKSVMPRVAALIDAMQVSEVVAIHTPRIFERMIYAGNASQRVEVVAGKTVLTVRVSAFLTSPEGGAAAVESIPAAADPGLALIEEEALTTSSRPQLSDARIVVSGGRALGSAEKFEALIGSLADTLGAAIGASRAAVDAGYATNDCQVGQTGKIVSPELYVAVGISGAIQHLAGMKDARIVVAINKDADAPIFKIADYGLVGDLFELIPELQRQLASLPVLKHTRKV
jgi:electron transfer flavoprotein alpha subunit